MPHVQKERLRFEGIVFRVSGLGSSYPSPKPHVQGEWCWEVAQGVCGQSGKEDAGETFVVNTLDRKVCSGGLCRTWRQASRDTPGVPSTDTSSSFAMHRSVKSTPKNIMLGINTRQHHLGAAAETLESRPVCKAVQLCETERILSLFHSGQLFPGV